VELLKQTLETKSIIFNQIITKLNASLSIASPIINYQRLMEKGTMKVWKTLNQEGKKKEENGFISFTLTKKKQEKYTILRDL
jgi:hypothetical protein